jgi:hypothetical protein
MVQKGDTLTAFGHCYTNTVLAMAVHEQNSNSNTNTGLSLVGICSPFFAL